MIDINEYEKLARDTGAYRDIELDILKETLVSWSSSPGAPFTILELRDGKLLAGFAVLCRAANTDFTFDVRSLCVERSYRGTAVGPRLLKIVEEETLRIEESAIVRYEISRRKEEALGPGLFGQCGYALIGHIQDFYESGDDYYIYARHLRRAQPDAGPETGPAPAAPGLGESPGGAP